MFVKGYEKHWCKYPFYICTALVIIAKHMVFSQERYACIHIIVAESD